jgi:hypothetical protein
MGAPGLRRIFNRGEVSGLAGLLLAGCAATTPSPPAPEEHLVVLNGHTPTLTIVPLSRPGLPTTIYLGPIGGSPWGISARGSSALVTTGLGNTVALVDLGSPHSLLVFNLSPGSGATGSAFVNDSIAYIANPLSNRVTRLNIRQGDTVSIAVGQTPNAVAVTRGRVYVANANLDPECPDGSPPCVLGPSWLSVIDPDRDVVVDSIPLPGPGNATSITVGGDGLLYVVSAGPGGDEPGRLIIVDPVLRQEVGSFAGFGPLPGQATSDGRERLFVTSLENGLMEFNTRTRRLVRGAGSGIPLEAGVDAAVGSDGLVYAIESGGCVPDVPGRIRVFRPDLTEVRVLFAGICPVDATIVRLLPED